MTSSPGRAEAVYDTIATVPELADVRDALHGGDWPAAEAALRARPADEAAYAIELLAEMDGIEGLLEEAVGAAPASACALTALARRYIVIGWQIRTGARAEDVSREQFEAFRSWLVKAEQLLIDACALDESYAPAWGVRVLTARALEVGPAEARRRYDRVRRLSPHDYPAQTHMLQYLLPKWAGSEEQAHDFARNAAAEAPPGSHSGALVPIVHIERWLDADGDAGGAYMAQPSVVEEVTDAAARSVLHPDYAAGPIGVQTHSAFAMALWLAGRNELAAVHFAALGGRATEFPWAYTFDDPTRLDQLRTAVLGADPRADRT
ncbi:hypothetical protein [Microbacterium sp. CFBP9034]|uniref:hypothetical protein n=1 Tax=Microbacterium sp. CFBP9034 TaxID=3096540 RepID=UPI002A6B6665|nr:hypothetical protein [Microbacterium sp. CFBP9034]MDY0909100.1 hypothetical protein [Microbacterium sp. CFBP9034]